MNELNDRIKNFVSFLQSKAKQASPQETPEENRLRGIYKTLAWFGDIIQKTREEIKVQLDTRNEQLVKEILGILERFKQEIITEVIKLIAEAQAPVQPIQPTGQTPTPSIDGIPVQVPQPIPPENK